MREFNLTSVNWDTVRGMQAGQFQQETHYLEELVRWTLQRGRIVGLLDLADGGVSRPSPEGEQRFSVSVRGCLAVGPEGYLIDIPNDEEDAVSGLIEARGAAVPLYVGVAKIERAREPEMHPSGSRDLLHCGGLRRQYRLATDSSDGAFDWLQIARFEKTAAGLLPDPYFFPECVFLSSHKELWEAQVAIQQRARQALETLERHSIDAVPVFAAAAALAGSLGPAARVIDKKLAPRAYVDRLASVLAAQRSQLGALPSPNLAVYQDALDQLDLTLGYLDDEHWALGRALALARECFERLLLLYPRLLESLNTVAMPAPPPQKAKWEIAEPAPPPGQPTYPGDGDDAPSYTAASDDDEPPAPPRPRRPSIWRR